MQRDCLILFRSLTHAQRAARMLERSGITATIRRAPPGLTDRGCTYCVRLRAQKLQEALALLAQRGVDRGRVFLLNADGSAEEVRP